uniref:Neurotransmitter-gated ion-channel ligand-binding domain-containing protein n=1 Tax=Meloidogyne javanica TaxID=6303 RepID=A0A915N126_MELJA
MFEDDGKFLPHVRLSKDLVEKYDNRVRPVLNHSRPTFVNFTMSLYQILAINEKVQSVDLNLWVIQKWHDEFLGWDPNKYGGINDTILPHEKIWLPDTYLYNSMVMNREETERYINVVVIFMYPALYRVSCRINILYFPYDQQNCTLIISSWTSDISSIDYQPDANSVNLHSFIRNEEWEVVSFEIRRVQKFVCCPEPWVLLHASLVVRRKPLYYIVNLVLPTSVITLVAVTGFFTPASTSNERREKLSLGIDSVSEQMPTTSDYLPLFGIFYLSIILIIFAGTLITALVLNVHLQKIYNRPISPLISFIFFHKLAPWMGVRPSTVLLELWQETEESKGFELKTRQWRHSPSIFYDGKEDDQQQQFFSLDINHNNGLTIEKSIKARQNWRRIAQMAYAKHKELIERGGEQNNILLLDEIPYADISPGRNSFILPSQQQSQLDYLQLPLNNNNLNKKLITISSPPNKCPPPIPKQNKKENLNIYPTTSSNNSLPNSFQLLLIPPKIGGGGGGNETTKINAAAVLDLKLRRRFAHEWEFLATVLDRVLLIIFSGLVIFVTGAMILCGEVILRSYPNSPE